MTRKAHDFLVAPTQLGRSRDSPGPQRVSGVTSGIEPGGRNGALHRITHGLTAYRIAHQKIAGLDTAKQRTVPPPPAPQPAPQHPNRIGNRTTAGPHRDYPTPALLIALPMPHENSQPLALEGHIGKLQTGELRPPQAGGEAKHNQRAITRAEQRSSVTGANYANQIASIERALPPRPLPPLAPHRRKDFPHIGSHRRRMPTAPVIVSNGGNVPLSGRDLAPFLLKKPGHIERDRLTRGGQHQPAGGSAPARKQTPVRSVRLNRRRRSRNAAQRLTPSPQSRQVDTSQIEQSKLFRIIVTRHLTRGELHRKPTRSTPNCATGYDDRADEQAR